MATEITQILECIKQKKNFLLSGGAGSGKTHSLIEVVKNITAHYPKSSIACITYTNVAVNEIKERAPFEQLQVTTIHDFLWDIISHFQKDLKKALVKLVDEEKIRSRNKSLITHDFLKSKKISYKEWLKLSTGTISHDEVILLAEELFIKNTLLSHIIKDRYNFILIDEYQDTFQSIIDILLLHLKKSTKSNIIGFFGDPMQSIFSDNGNRAGNIDYYIESGDVHEIIKEENRRNPSSIIGLINNLRTDGLTQTPSADESSLNFNVEGKLSFIYSQIDNYHIDTIKQLPFFTEFNFSDNKNTKELYLVHNLIASKAGFGSLMKVYDKDGIIKYKERIRKHIKEENIIVDENISFGELIEMLDKAPTTAMKSYISTHLEDYKEAKGYPYSMMKNIYPNKDQLIGDKKNSEALKRKKGEKRDDLIKHLFHIQECIYLYKNSKFNEFIQKTHYQISRVSDKIALKESIDVLSSMDDNRIEEVIEYAHQKKIWKKDDKLEHFVSTKTYLFNRVKEIKFKEIVSLFYYIEDFTPYSTQHNIKGAEFDNVFVILDNGKWNNYNFNYLFENKTDRLTIVERTRKIFYVCCSRAKKNLVVYFNNPSTESINTAKKWFGENNVHCINRLPV